MRAPSGYLGSILQIALPEGNVNNSRDFQFPWALDGSLIHAFYHRYSTKAPYQLTPAYTWPY